jgi:hypothetical protein
MKKTAWQKKIEALYARVDAGEIGEEDLSVLIMELGYEANWESAQTAARWTPNDPVL